MKLGFSVEKIEISRTFARVLVGLVGMACVSLFIMMWMW